MAEEIVNRVAKSPLVTIDLEDFYPMAERVLFDLKDYLFEEQILIEKDFRSKLKEHNWEQYSNKFVSVVCSTDAIVPSWAFLLISVYLSPYAKGHVIGNFELLESSIYQEIIENLPLEEYRDKPIIIKGCSEKPIPNSAYSFLIQKLRPIARSLMFGEACSSVPLFKQGKG